MIHNGKLANYIEKKEKNKGRVFILYLKYKKDQASKNMDKSAFNYNVVVGC
ncbi:phage regulatory protein [Salmonella enterica subsp. enterica serovar Javiana str. GA_MM04042433]|nr:phage regulatory protein [Salmonella enterica subsp. enterica serovar Javiana str. GA_MM04042433]